MSVRSTSSTRALHADNDRGLRTADARPDRGGIMRRWRLAALFVVIASAGLLLSPSAFSEDDASATAASSWPVKIFVCNTPATRVGDVLSNPYVAGTSSRFSWAAIEPHPREYRWGPIDHAIALARRAGKQAMIRVIAGIYTPTWVDRRVPTITFSNRYLYNPSNYPTRVTMPIPWKRAYLRYWKRFLGAFGARYNGNPTIYSVQMAGAGFIGEMTLPTDVDKWRSKGYTDDRYVWAWDRIIASYGRQFPSTHTNLDIDEPFGSLRDTNVVRPVVSFATSFGRHNYIQNNGLRAGMLGTIGPYRRAIRRAADTTRVGYQMIGPAPTSTSLHDAFRVAIQDQSSYIEVYASDVLDSTNLTELRYLASDGTS
jgi:hypothetical protein